ncbi:hypothetical protein FHS70_005706 [Flammeovirga yaeyamensis]|nr:hypothetical protein [Flammeovirga yaeyamensis]
MNVETTSFAFILFLCNKKNSISARKEIFYVDVHYNFDDDSSTTVVLLSIIKN